MPPAIILAAGSSTRLGQPKQDVVIANETLLARSIRTAQEAGLSPVFAVISSEWRLALGDAVSVLVNHDAAEGMASSIRCGIRAAIDINANGVVILACDQVAITPKHLEALALGGTEIRASSYAGRNGVPAYFPASVFKKLLDLRGDVGARELLRDAPSIPLQNGDLDIDTPEDLARARLLYPA